MRITDTLSLDDSLIHEQFIRSSGPGGQNVNKVATAVQLRFDIAGAPLDDAVKRRLRALGGSRVTEDDQLIIEAREHRTQSQNREAARERLAGLVAAALTPARRRRKTKPPRASREKRLESKKQRSAVKQNRRVKARDI